jgi:hypothetical protein
MPATMPWFAPARKPRQVVAIGASRDYIWDKVSARKVERMVEGVASFVGALIADVIAGGAIERGLSAYETRKDEEARAIWMKEVVTGEKTLVDAALQDQLFAVWLRFRHATRTGVAREKLRIMARMLNGQLEATELSPEAFSQFATFLEGLRLEELAYLVTRYELERAAPADDKQRGERATWIEQRLQEKMIPGVVADRAAFEAVEASVMRTGLMIGPELMATEGSEMRTSPMMAELVRIAKLQRSFTAED